MKNMFNLIKFKYLFIGSTIGLLLFPMLVQAQTQIIPTSYAGQPSVPASPSAIVALIFHVSLSIAAAIFLLMFLFGGFQYLTSAGNEDGVDKAKKTMLNAVIGLIIIVGAYAIGTFILKALGYNI